MKSRHFTSIVAVFLTVILVAPSVFLAVPQTVHAQGVPTMELPISPLSESTFLDTAKNTLTAWAQYADWTNKNILMPLALIKSIGLMKAMTAGVIAFVTGKTNGTGGSQFVQNLQGNLQGVGNAVALPFIYQIRTGFNSPFGSAISASLNQSYAQQTSLAGFFAANQSTLPGSLQSQQAFLAGNWSQGGIASWFALTTQTQNNPYTLYQASQSQLASVVGSAQAARSAVLSWGQGMMSWCGVSDAATQTQDSAATSYQQCQASGKSGAECQAVFDAAGGNMPTGGGVNPGDACTNSDGTPGTIKTPGSVITASLNKVLGGGQDKLTQLGNIGSNVASILGSIGTIMQTVNLAENLLSGPNSGGLTGAGGSVVLNRNVTDPVLVAAQSSVYQNATASEVSGSGMSDRITRYEQEWNTIVATANTAKTSVNALVTYCNTQAKDPNASPSVITAQVNAAQTALATEIAPIFVRADAASVTIAAARALMTKIQNESNSGATAESTYAADIQTLQTMPPTDYDVIKIQQETQSSSGIVVASPVGSLTVSGGSLVDQMNLISTNATTLKSVCTPVAPVDYTSLMPAG